MRLNMRDIKFRAWDKIYKKMHYKGLMLEIDDGTIGYQKTITGDISPFDLEIMQYTGLKDENGKEIYEGDIIECIDMHDCNIEYWIIKPPRYEVKWDNKETGFCLGNPYKSLPSKYDIEINWKVIDNIYENPELLESNNV